MEETDEEDDNALQCLDMNNLFIYYTQKLKDIIYTIKLSGFEFLKNVKM